MPGPSVPIAVPFTVRPPRGVVERMLRMALIAAGVLTILLGIIIAPLPGPFGVPVMAVGLIIVLRNSYRAKRWFVRAVRRFPRLAPLRRVMRPGAPVGAMAWHQALKIERFFVQARTSRFATRLRKRLKPRKRRPAPTRPIEI